MAGELRACDCYIGQRVFCVMWCDPNDDSANRKGWYYYRRGRSPEIWSFVVDRLPRNGSIMLRGCGKAGNVYSCEINAVRGQYELFCQLHLGGGFGRPACSLGDASKALRELAELEFGVHASSNMEITHGR